jgi:hypothetical protein
LSRNQRRNLSLLAGGDCADWMRKRHHQTAERKQNVKPNSDHADHRTPFFRSSQRDQLPTPNRHSQIPLLLKPERPRYQKRLALSTEHLSEVQANAKRPIANIALVKTLGLSRRSRIETNVTTQPKTARLLYCARRSEKNTEAAARFSTLSKALAS